VSEAQEGIAMRQTITCAQCGGTIGPHYQLFDHIRCQSGDLTPEQNAQVAAMERRLQERIVAARFRKALLAMSGALMWGHTTLGKALFDAACVRDPALIYISDDPILNAKADWRRKWAALKDAAGVTRDDRSARKQAGEVPREYWGVPMDEQTRRLLSD
jgi:hypothetical protein